MLNALKKLTIKQDSTSLPPDSAGQPMSGSLQKKFSKGVNYNMKIIIKGDRNVGKSCLLKRLQGGEFIETYTPTEEIQVASIQWSFKATEDIVKVEVWDVVDRGKARSRHIGLKLSTGALPEAPALDAEFLDVYKGTHGVILMMDVTKSWTFDYITKELPKVPSEIPVLVLGNHCDMNHHRVISTGQAAALIETVGENRAAEVLYAESSMRNGFGLRLLHKFLGLPFLRLQKETLLGLIERNKRDTEICEFEISEFLKSDDADYSKFLNNLSNKRRQLADSNSRVSSGPHLMPSTLTSTSLSQSASNSSILSQKSQNINGINANLTQELRPTKSIIVGGGQPIIIPGQINVTQQIKQGQQKNNSNNVTNNKIGCITLPSNLDIPQKDLVTALLQKSCETNKNSKQQQNNDQHKICSVEEFCPDEGILDRSFLDDISSGNNTINTSNEINDSDSDNDMIEGNPMVAKFNDEPDDDVYNSTNISNETDKNKIKTFPDKIVQTKINPLAKQQFQQLQRKYSISSEEISNITGDSSNNNNNVSGNNSSLLYDDNLSDNNWLPETTIRQSPEGGEDTSSIPSLNQDDSSILITSTKSSTSPLTEKRINKHNSHHKKKRDKKDKKKKRSKETDLEEFLNGTASDTSSYRIDESAYEAI